MEQKSRWQRFKDWWTIDHVVDLIVDALLLIWEVIASPVLILVRIIRHFIGDWFVTTQILNPDILKSAIESATPGKISNSSGELM